MKTKVFVIENIELVRVDVCNRAQINLQEVLFWFLQKNGATSCHSDNEKVIHNEGLKVLCSKKTNFFKMSLRLNSKNCVNSYFQIM